MGQRWQKCSKAQPKLRRTIFLNVPVSTETLLKTGCSETFVVFILIEETKERSNIKNRVRPSKPKSFKVDIHKFKPLYRFLSKLPEHKQSNILEETAMENKCSCNVMLRMTQVDLISSSRYPHLLRALINLEGEVEIFGDKQKETRPC